MAVKGFEFLTDNY